jgi:molecular chaperone DnaK (HSP70)
VLVYRVGGVTCDVTLMKVNQGLYEVLGYIHDNTMGGKQLTDLLVEYIALEFFKKYKLDPRENRRTMIKLSHSVENSKHILSAMETVHVFVESLMDGIDFTLNVSRARFENLIVGLLPNYTQPIQRLFEKLQFKGKIDKIVLCGGSMRIPKLQATISSFLPDAEIFSNISCDEVIAIGCAKQAALLQISSDKPEGECEFLDVATEFDAIDTDIYAELVGGADAKKLEETCLFKQGSVVDSEKKVKMVKTPADKEVSLKLNIYERLLNMEPKLLDSIEIDEDLAKKEIEFTARIKTNGIEIDFVK